MILTTVVYRKGMK